VRRRPLSDRHRSGFAAYEGSALLGAIDQVTVLAESAARLHVPHVMERVEKPRKKALTLLGKGNDRGGLDLCRWK
jgi:hypothetical protein